MSRRVIQSLFLLGAVYPNEASSSYTEHCTIIHRKCSPCVLSSAVADTNYIPRRDQLFSLYDLPAGTAAGLSARRAAARTAPAVSETPASQAAGTPAQARCPASSLTLHFLLLGIEPRVSEQGLIFLPHWLFQSFPLEFPLLLLNLPSGKGSAARRRGGSGF